MTPATSATGPATGPAAGPASGPVGGPVTVGINLLWLVPGVVGGSEDYTIGVLEAVADGGHTPLPTLFVNRLFAQRYEQLCARFPVVVAPVSGANKAMRVLADNVWLPVALRRHHITVVHHAGGLVPFLDAGVGAHGARVTTIHDLQPLELPHNFSAVKRWFEAVAIPWSVRHTDVFVTLSDHVATRVTDVFGVSPSRFRRVTPGPERAQAGMSADTTGGSTGDTGGDVAARLGLVGHPYFVYPAITYPHKNHQVLVDAVAQVVVTHPDVRLVFTGGAGGAQADLDAAIDAAGPGVADRIVRPGRVASGDLVALYRGATAMLFPSRFEGFGLPVIEAMRLGCPVVASNIAALVERTGGAAVLCDPGDPSSWARAMTTLCDDPGFAARVGDAGRRHTEQLSWPDAAAAMVAAWCDAAVGAQQASRRARLNRLPSRRQRHHAARAPHIPGTRTAHNVAEAVSPLHDTSGSPTPPGPLWPDAAGNKPGTPGTPGNPGNPGDTT